MTVVLADDRPTRWELAWDSTWEHPDESRSAAIEGALHADAGTPVLLEPLTLRVYTAPPAPAPSPTAAAPR